MSRAKLFLENFFAYGFIQVLNKIVPLLLLPVITSLLPNTSDFGVFDMFNLIVGFGTPLAILGMSDAMFREYFDTDDQQLRYNVTTTAQIIVLISSIIICITLILFNDAFAKMFFGTDIYSNIVIYSSIALFLSSNSNIIQAPTRMQNKRRIFVFSGLLSSGGGYLISILLIWLGFSYFGLIYSSILTTGMIILFFWILNNRFFLLGRFDKKIAKELFKIGLPLLPTFLIYWIYNSMDRIMITNMLGTTELGIYAIGARLSSISQFIHMAFSGGWQYFAFSTMKDEDYKDLMGKVWENLFIVSTCFFVCGFICKDLLFNLLFQGDYVKGVIVFPYLLLAPLLLMLYQILGTQFQIIKQTFYSPLMLSAGALINVILNMYLIPRMGIEGAAIATIIGYFISNLLSILLVVKIKKLVTFSKKIHFMIGIFLLLFVLINCYDLNIYTILLCLAYLVTCFFLYYKEAFKLLKGKKSITIRG